MVAAMGKAKGNSEMPLYKSLRISYHANAPGQKVALNNKAIVFLGRGCWTGR